MIPIMMVRYPTSHLPPKDFNYDIAIEAIKEIDKYVKPGNYDCIDIDYTT